MPKYRKKPVIVDAVKLERNYQSIVNAVELVFHNGMETSVIGMNATVKSVMDDGGIIIETLEGNMKEDFGDYIIQGVNGEFYPCKSDIFEKTYEAVD